MKERTSNRKSLAERRELLSSGRESTSRKWLIWLALGVIIFGGYWLVSGNPTSLPFESSSERVDAVLNSISDNSVKELLDLEGSEPIIATVLDTDQMKSQDPEFYSEVEEGDTLIILNNKKLVILYRSSSDRIINIGSGVLALTGDLSL